MSDTVFQLTAPLREPTVRTTLRSTAFLRFQLTAPLREPTIASNDADIAQIVSTHGSLAGADLTLTSMTLMASGFQLTAPLREPTGLFGVPRALIVVSTHGSLAGAD